MSQRHTPVSPNAPDADPEIRGSSLERKLLRSHLVVALIGVVMLLVSLLVILQMRSSAVRLATLRGPTAQASTQSLSGVERSLAGLRGWVVAANPAFREDRAGAWDDEIWPTLNKLNDLSANWTDPNNNQRLTELTVLLSELNEAQWWIEDVAQTPGNEPARVLFLDNVYPVSRDIFRTATTLIELEKELDSGAQRKLLLGIMADFRSDIGNSSMRLNTFVQTATDADKSAFHSDIQSARQLLSELTKQESFLSEEQNEHLESLQRELQAYAFFADEVIEARESEQWNVAQHLLATEAIPLARRARQLLLAMSTDQSESMQADARQVTAISNTAVVISIALVAITMLVAWLVSHRSAIRMSQPILALSDATAELAAGRLTEDIAVHSDDELGQLTNSFNAMRGSLRLAERAEQLDRQNQELNQKNHQIEQQGRQISERTLLLEQALDDTRRTAEELDVATSEMLAVTAQQASGAQQQGAAVTQTATSIEQVATVAVSTAKRAENVGLTSKRAVEIGQQGRQAVDDSIAAMNSVKGHVNDIAQRIRHITDQTSSIAAIVGAVDEIADQTSLLALNAAIEAAHAGEQGKGFDIVAKEVKALAEQSKQATLQVRGFLNSVSEAINAAAQSAEIGSQDAAAASGVVAKAGETISTLASALDETAQAAAHIADAATDQAHGMQQISHAVANIDDVTKQNTVSAQQIEQTAHSLGALGQRLKNSLTTGRTTEPAKPSN